MDFLGDIIHLNDMDEDAMNEALLSYTEKKKVSAIRKDSVKNRKFRQRKSWVSLSSNLKDRQFRRCFWMSRECFGYLCYRIENNVGEKTSKVRNSLEVVGNWQWKLTRNQQGESFLERSNSH